MSQTLGEKLRQAREERGISISEVAEQTRISSLYLESIEKDDYKPLPGGIFNKGFVKSYAKFIGFDEEEALSDYARLAAANEIVTEHDQRVYRPEVLTDDRTSSSMLPTILFAGVILALMTGGILFVLNYIQNQDSQTANTNMASANLNSASSNTNANVAVTTPAPVETTPTMETVNIEFSAATDPVSLLSVSDGTPATAVVATGTSVSFEPKVSLRLSYSKALAQSAKLSINGKPILLPETPQNPRRNAIIFVIDKDNLAKIWEEGKISYDVLAGGVSNSNSVNVAPVTPVPTLTPSSTAVPTRPPPTATPRPRPTPARTPPPANRPSPNTGAMPRPSPN